jgi:hypothetical protein
MTTIKVKISFEVQAEFIRYELRTLNSVSIDPAWIELAWVTFCMTRNISESDRDSIELMTIHPDNQSRKIIGVALLIHPSILSTDKLKMDLFHSLYREYPTRKHTF